MKNNILNEEFNVDGFVRVVNDEIDKGMEDTLARHCLLRDQVPDLANPVYEICKGTKIVAAHNYHVKKLKSFHAIEQIMVPMEPYVTLKDLKSYGKIDKKKNTIIIKKKLPKNKILNEKKAEENKAFIEMLDYSAKHSKNVFETNKKELAEKLASIVEEMKKKDLLPRFIICNPKDFKKTILKIFCSKNGFDQCFTTAISKCKESFNKIFCSKNGFDQCFTTAISKCKESFNNTFKGFFWGIDVHTYRHCKEGYMYLIPQPEFLGVIPTKQISADGGDPLFVKKAYMARGMAIVQPKNVFAIKFK